MASDSHGMPVPIKMTPLPWRLADEADVVDAEGEMVCDCNGTQSGAEFQVHAANWIIPCREIVRRLAEAENWPDRMMVAGEALSIAEDAAKLWAKMQRDAKGSDSETSV